MDGHHDVLSGRPPARSSAPHSVIAMAPRNNTLANRLLLLALALLAGVVYLLYRLKGRPRA